ncbi:MAG: ABC transporter permease [Proteobacteria bacterium]|nr:ABC transporter permease [Pseudomonadota bacterium]
MKTYVINRIFLMLITLIGMSVLIFALLRLAPGNIVDILFDSAGYVDQADKKLIEAELGLDRPLVMQYLGWIGDLARGNLGKSYRLEIPAWQVIAPRIPVTLELAVLSLFFAVLFGVPLGVISAVKQDSALDYLLRVFSLSGLSMPSFWLGMMVILVLVLNFDLSPIYIEPPKTFADHVRLFGIPAAAVGFRSSALIMRLTRSAMLEVLRQDYIQTARAKGLNARVINYHHALKNAILPVVTVIGIEAAFLIGGLIITETVFNIPGVARFLVQAILWRDYPIVQNLVMFIALIVVSTNLIVDLLYVWLDPRVQFG